MVFVVILPVVEQECFFFSEFCCSNFNDNNLVSLQIYLYVCRMNVPSFVQQFTNKNNQKVERGERRTIAQIWNIKKKTLFRFTCACTCTNSYDTRCKNISISSLEYSFFSFFSLVCVASHLPTVLDCVER